MPFAVGAAHNPLQTEGSDLPRPPRLPCPTWSSSRGAERVDLRGPGTSLTSPPRADPRQLRAGPASSSWRSSWGELRQPLRMRALGTARRSPGSGPGLPESLWVGTWGVPELGSPVCPGGTDCSGASVLLPILLEGLGRGGNLWPSPWALPSSSVSGQPLCPLPVEGETGSEVEHSGSQTASWGQVLGPSLVPLGLPR